MPGRGLPRPQRPSAASLIFAALALAVGLRLMALPESDGRATTTTAADPRRLGGEAPARAWARARARAENGADEDRRGRPELEPVPELELELGRELFYERSPSGSGGGGSARAACDALDDVRTLGRRRADAKDGKGPPCPFADCMDALESAQRTYAEAFPSETEASPVVDEKQLATARFHAAWLTEGPLVSAARLALWGAVRAYPPGHVRITVWVRTVGAKMELDRQLRSWPELARAVIIEALDAMRLTDEIANVFPSLCDVVESYQAKMQRYLQARDHDAPSNAARDSDLLRVLVLAARGGVYLDLDVLLLRPLTPLLSRDFYYRWSSEPYCNTAVLHLRRGSENAERLVRAALSRPGPPKGAAKFLHPVSISRHARWMGLTVEMLPSAYFDPVWVLHDEGPYMDQSCVGLCRERYGIGPRLGGFFSGNNTVLAAKMREQGGGTSRPSGHLRDVFFSGAFAFHWHNQWDDAVLEDSTGGIFLRYFESSSSGTS